MAWVSPVPAGIGSAARVFRPGVDVRVVANTICERGWKGTGVRVFRWPCGTVSVVTVGARGDVLLLRESLPQLFATYVRDANGVGPKLVDVIHALNWARAAA
jgi:hypothetical protein